MSIYPIVTEQDLIILRKIAEQMKKTLALAIENRVSKQTHDGKLAGSLSPITEKIEEVKESTQKIGEIVEKSDVEDENTQTPAIETITGTKSLRDTLSFMKRNKNFSKLVIKRHWSCICE